MTTSLVPRASNLHSCCGGAPDTGTCQNPGCQSGKQATVLLGGLCPNCAARKQAPVARAAGCLPIRLIPAPVTLLPHLILGPNGLKKPDGDEDGSCCSAEGADGGGTGH